MKLHVGWQSEYVLSGLLLLLLFAPVIAFLWEGWAARRREIVGAFSEKAAECYLRTFFAGDHKRGENARITFQRNYGQRFGRQHFLVPVLCLLGVSAASIFLCVRVLSEWLQTGPQSVPLQVAAAAIAGAYMWVCYDLIRRAQGRDLRPVHLLWASFRFAVAVPLGLAFAALVKEEVGVPIAFMLGAFPTRTLFTFARRMTVPRLGLGEHPAEASSELEVLQGVGKGGAERFEDEGVNTILQLAYADPVDLAIRTNSCFSYVVDCCSQALAWLYLQDDLAKLRPLGLRGAQEISSLCLEMGGRAGGTEPEAKHRAALARQALESAAEQLALSPHALEYTLTQIGEDPFTQFLCDVWACS
jgi:hypothetical protein